MQIRTTYSGFVNFYKYFVCRYAGNRYRFHPDTGFSTTFDQSFHRHKIQSVIGFSLHFNELIEWYQSTFFPDIDLVFSSIHTTIKLSPLRHRMTDCQVRNGKKTTIYPAGTSPAQYPAPPRQKCLFLSAGGLQTLPGIITGGS
jgi:hypothetical protein